MIRQTVSAIAAAVAAAVLAGSPAGAQDKIKIGYAVSKTGPNAAGAGITTIPNYQLWIHDLNAAGGLKVGDKIVPIEVDRIRRPVEHRGTGAGGRAAGQPGQGRHPPVAVGHRHEPRGRADLQQVRLPAPCGDRRHRPRLRDGRALAELVLDARHVDHGRQRAGRGADQAQGCRHDQQQDRDGRGRRRLRHRAVGRGASGAGEGRIRAGARRELPDHHPGLLADHRLGQGHRRRHLRRLQLSARTPSG